MQPGSLPGLDHLHLLTPPRVRSASAPPKERRVARTTVEHRHETRERLADVGDDAERQRAGDAEVTRVDVDLHDPLRRGIAPVFVVRQVEVPEPRSRDEHDVGLTLGEVAARAEAVDRVRMIVRHDGARGHRRDDRTREAVDDREQRLVGAGTVDARAGDHERPRRTVEEIRGRPDLRIRRLGRRTIRRRR